MQYEHASASLLCSFVTGVVVAIPEAALTYSEKIGSVFLLAMVAEVGRRLIARFWKERKP